MMTEPEAKAEAEAEESHPAEQPRARRVANLILDFLDDFSFFFAGAVVLALLVVFFMFAVGYWRVATTADAMETAKAMAVIANEVADSRKEIKRLNDLVNGLQAAPPTGDAVTAAKLAALEQAAADLSKKMQVIEDGLGDSPERALSVALLRKEVDALTSAHDLNTERTKTDVDRVYDQNKWMIGLLMTAMLSILLPAFLHYRRDAKKDA